MRGAFIVFEGIDRSGKSTQVERLLQTLDNSERLQFPNRSSSSGLFIDSYLYLQNSSSVQPH